MHSSTLLTCALAVGALALPQGQRTATVFNVVTVTTTVYVRPGATPAWSPPQLKDTKNPYIRPSNAPPAWTPPRIGQQPPPATSRPGAPVNTPPVNLNPAQPSSSSAVATPIQNLPAAPAGPSSTPPPAGIVAPDNGHISGASQASLSVGAEYQRAILYHHNAARANHGAAPLTWNDNLAATAALAADTCRFEHYIPPGVRQGQNLFTVSGPFFNVTAGITEAWYKSELPPMLPYFGQRSIPDSVFHSVGHLTQILWKGTTQVGCVSKDCGNSMIVGGAPSTLNKYTVCNYGPAGNIDGQYALNVGLPISTTNLGSWSD